MKQDYSKFLKKLLLGSLGSLLSINSFTTKGIEPKDLVFENTDDNISSEDFNIKELSKKLVLTTSEDGWESFSHRSHRSHRSHSSHRSHRSHYSSSSGSSSSSTSTYKRTYNTTTKKTTTSPKKSSSIYKIPKVTNLHLGDRIIKPKMYGSDVTQLINILLKNKYLIREDKQTIVYGLKTYEGAVINALKEFQRLNNLPVDGIVGAQTVLKLLKN
jgi:murein L,D-transpeptidase YcbB/YkuD